MRLICTCKVCGHDDDWSESKTEDYYFCQSCHTESHKGSMKLEFEFYGVKVFPVDFGDEDEEEETQINRYVSETENCENCMYNKDSSLCYERWDKMSNLPIKKFGDGLINCWEQED